MILKSILIAFVLCHIISYKFDIADNSLGLESLINSISQVLRQRPDVLGNLPSCIMHVTVAFNSGPRVPGYILPGTNKNCVSPISDFIEDQSQAGFTEPALPGMQRGDAVKLSVGFSTTHLKTSFRAALWPLQFSNAAADSKVCLSVTRSSGGQQPRRHTDICVLCILYFLLGKFVRNSLGDGPSEHVEKTLTSFSCCSKEKLQRKKIMQTPTALELIRKCVCLSLKEK